MLTADFGRCCANKLLGISLSSSSIGYKEEEVISGTSFIAGSRNKRCRITFQAMREQDGHCVNAAKYGASTFNSQPKNIDFNEALTG